MKWATRDHVHFDRVISAWAIKRFVDPDAEFAFVGWGAEVGAPSGTLAFALAGGELGQHDALGTTFRKILGKFELEDAALSRIADVIDCGFAYAFMGAHPGPNDEDGQIAVGLLSLAEGMLLIHHDDNDVLEASFPIYDALYASFQTLAAMAARSIPRFDFTDPSGPASHLDRMRAIHHEIAVSESR